MEGAAIYKASPEALEDSPKAKHGGNDLEKIVVRLDKDDAYSSWPRRGVVQFDNVWMKYSPLAPFALKGVSFTLNHQDKVRRLGMFSFPSPPLGSG